jgi:hypothetical protein
MFKVKFFIVLLALVGTASFPVSSYAGSGWGRVVAADAADAMPDIGVGMVEDAIMAPPARGFGGPVVLVRGLTYQDWLQRQRPPGAILYNMPCTVSDGVREHGVPCEAVAAALSGQFIPGVYPVEQPALAYAGDAPCYYDDGWNGPGYYRRGSAWNRGYGWSGHHLSGGPRRARFGHAGSVWSRRLSWRIYCVRIKLASPLNLMAAAQPFRYRRGRHRT